jgi:hypothetical protein
VTPGKHDLLLYRGDTHAFRVLLWSDDLQTVPYDLAGSTVAAEIREKSAGTHVVDMIVVVTLPNTVDITIEPNMFVTCPSRGVWDVQVTTSSGEVLTPLGGAVTVTPDVTDSVPMPARAR